MTCWQNPTLLARQPLCTFAFLCASGSAERPEHLLHGRERGPRPFAITVYVLPRGHAQESRAKHHGFGAGYSYRHSAGAGCRKIVLSFITRWSRGIAGFLPVSPRVPPQSTYLYFRNFVIVIQPTVLLFAKIGQCPTESEARVVACTIPSGRQFFRTTPGKKLRESLPQRKSRA